MHFGSLVFIIEKVQVNRFEELNCKVGVVVLVWSKNSVFVWGLNRCGVN